MPRSPKHLPPRIRLIAAAIVTMAACSSSLLEPIAPCSDDQWVTVEVSAGTTPRFTWEPACGIAALWVIPVADPVAGWVLNGGLHASENPLPSGIRYGEVPPKGVQQAPAGKLVPGVVYRLTVFRWIGDVSGGQLNERGSVNFAP
jgi:hypothetical protein